MKPYVVYSLLVIVFFGCSKNAPKEAEIQRSEDSELFEKNTTISKKEAYAIVIAQKLQEVIDKEMLIKGYPDFSTETDQDKIFLEDSLMVKKVEFIEPFKNISDSVKIVKTKVVFESRIDTLLTLIKTSNIKIDEETLKTTKITFKSIEKRNISDTKLPEIKAPKYVEKFSIKDLNFTWEEINACDCLFMVNAGDTSYERLYFGRFKDNENGILQLGKNTEKFIIPIKNPRSKARNPGSFWKETYQNHLYKIRLKATPTTPRVKSKYTYYIDFTLIEFSSRKTIKNTLLANCKS